MLRFYFIFITGSVLVVSMYFDTIFTGVYYSVNCNSVDITEELSSLMALLDLQTEIPANGYHFTNLTDLVNLIREANFTFELGYALINGVLVYAINIGNTIYSVEPSIFHSLIFMLF